MPKDERYLLVELPLREAFEEITAGVFEYARLNDEHAIKLIILKFDNSGLIKDWLDLFFQLLLLPEADTGRIGSSASALRVLASYRL